MERSASIPSHSDGKTATAGAAWPRMPAVSAPGCSPQVVSVGMVMGLHDAGCVYGGRFTAVYAEHVAGTP